MTTLKWDAAHSLGTTLSLGDTKATIDNNANVGGQGGVRALIGRSTGKRYFEFVINVDDPSSPGLPAIGITDQFGNSFAGNPGRGVGFYNNAYLHNDTEGGAWATYGAATGWVNAAIFVSATLRYGVKVDFDNGWVDIISLAAPEGTHTVPASTGHDAAIGITPGGNTWYPNAGCQFGNGADHSFSVTIYGRETEFTLPHDAAFIGWAMDVPVADFTSDPVAPATAVAPAIVQFTSTSTGDIATYLWTFNDGDTSDQENPVHAFHEAGTYAVSLTVSNSAGSDTKTVSTFITVTDPPVIGSDDRHPRIGYRCIAHDTDSTITSDSTATGYDASNPFNWKPYDYWKPDSGGEHYIQIVLDEAEVADYIAIAQHNLGENAGTFRLAYSNDSGGSWSDAIADYSPSGRESIWLDFDAISANYWRVYTNSATASVLGVVAFGRKYRPRYGQFAGFMPPKLARSFDLYASTSEAGLFLGRTILRKKLKGSIAFDLMEISDAYGDWHPFMRAAEQHPFFLAWLLEDWPEDVQLVETSGDWKAPAITQFGFIGTAVNWIGLLQE